MLGRRMESSRPPESFVLFLESLALLYAKAALIHDGGAEIAVECLRMDYVHPHWPR